MDFNFGELQSGREEERRKIPIALNVEELANELRISKTNAYALVKSKEFPAFKIGKRILVPVKELEKWLDMKTKSR